MGWEKLGGYWKNVVFEPFSSYYYIATALHPRLCLLWFKDKGASSATGITKPNRTLEGCLQSTSPPTTLLMMYRQLRTSGDSRQ